MLKIKPNLKSFIKYRELEAKQIKTILEYQNPRCPCINTRRTQIKIIKRSQDYSVITI